MRVLRSRAFERTGCGPTAARYRDLWQTEWLFGTVFCLALCRSNAASRPAGSMPAAIRTPAGNKENRVQKKLVKEKNGSEVHTEFLHHRAH
jgi:hypothetical protein